MGNYIYTVYLYRLNKTATNKRTIEKKVIAEVERMIPLEAGKYPLVIVV